MSALQETPRKQPQIRTLAVVTDDRRRRALALLREYSGPTAERELAADLAASERGDGEDAVTETTEAVRTTLRHVHLPKLDDAGLVEWDREAATVATADHPYSDDPRFGALLDADGDEVSTVVDGVAHERRAAALAALEPRNEPLRRTALAAAVATREASGTPTSEAVERVRIQLHHVHLPKLDDAGLVDYDADDGTAAYRGLPDVPGADLLAECYA